MHGLQMLAATAMAKSAHTDYNQLRKIVPITMRHWTHRSRFYLLPRVVLISLHCLKYDCPKASYRIIDIYIQLIRVNSSMEYNTNGIRQSDYDDLVPYLYHNRNTTNSLYKDPVVYWLRLRNSKRCIVALCEFDLFFLTIMDKTVAVNQFACTQIPLHLQRGFIIWFAHPFALLTNTACMH